MAYISINFANNGTISVTNGADKAPMGNNVAQVHLSHEFDFGQNVVLHTRVENSTAGIAEYKSKLTEKIKIKRNIEQLEPEHKTAVEQMAKIKSMVFVFEFKDRTDGGTLGVLRGRLHDGGGFEDLEENWSDNPSFVSMHLDYYGVLSGQSLFERVESVLNHKSMATTNDVAQVFNGLNAFVTKNGFNQGYASNKRFVQTTLPNYVHPTDKAFAGTGDNAAKWQLLIREVEPNYIGIIGVDDVSHINTLVSVNERTGGHLFIDVGEKTSVSEVVALADTLNYNNHQIRLLWNPTKSRPRDGSSIRKTWRPCVGDYMAKHILRNNLRDANGIPPLHIPIGGFDFPVSFLGTQYLDNFYISDAEQEDLAQAGVIMVINERFNRQSMWVYGDVLTQRNSKTSALRLANAAEIETFTARTIIEISKRYLLSSMANYQSRCLSDGVRFMDNCVAAGLLEPAEQLGGLYYTLTIAPREDKPFEAVDIHLARRATGAVRQAYLETTINK